MNEFWKMAMMFLFGAGGLAIINIIQERWKMRYNRKAEMEDKAEERENKLDDIDKKLSDFIEAQADVNRHMAEKQEAQEKELAAQSTALKYVILDRILDIGQNYIKRGEVTFDERKRLREMHDCYHNDLGGNGDADAIMKTVDELPLKQN